MYTSVYDVTIGIDNGLAHTSRKVVQGVNKAVDKAVNITMQTLSTKGGSTFESSGTYLKYMVY